MSVWFLFLYKCSLKAFRIFSWSLIFLNFTIMSLCLFIFSVWHFMSPFNLKALFSGNLYLYLNIFYFFFFFFFNLLIIFSFFELHFFLSGYWHLHNYPPYLLIYSYSFLSFYSFLPSEIFSVFSFNSLTCSSVLFSMLCSPWWHIWVVFKQCLPL